MSTLGQISGELAGIFNKLSDEVVWLHFRWNLYRQLYATNPERIELLNNTAALFFEQLQRVLLDDLILGLSRLTDPLKSGRGCRQNLVLEQLSDQLHAPKNPVISATLNERLSGIKDNCAELREHRNRRIAHRDLRTAVNPRDNLLTGISKKMIEDVLKKIREFMNEFEACWGLPETAYQHFITTAGGDALILSLKKAVEYKALVREGKIPRDHLKKSKYWSA